MFLSNIRKSISDFIIWKSTRPKGVLTVAVLNDLIGVPLPNLILIFLTRKVSIYSWFGYSLIKAKY